MQLIDPSAFAKLTPTQRANQRTTLDYLSVLARDTKADLSTWPVVDLFKRTGSADAGTLQLYVDPPKINQLFFAALKAGGALKVKAEPADAEALDLSDQIVQAFSKASAQQLENLDKEEKKILDLAAKLVRDANKHVANAAEIASRTMRLRNNVPVLPDEIKSIEDKGTFKLDRIENDTRLIFHTVNPIVLYTDPESEPVSKSSPVDLGRFEIRYDLACNGFGIVALDRISDVERPHPHLDGGGGVCWGRVHHTATDLIKQCRIAELLELTYNVLNTYNVGDRYVKVSLLGHLKLKKEYKAKLAATKDAETGKVDVDAAKALIEEAKAVYAATGLQSHWRDSEFPIPTEGINSAPAADGEFPLGPPEE